MTAYFQLTGDELTSTKEQDDPNTTQVNNTVIEFYLFFLLSEASHISARRAVRNADSKFSKQYNYKYPTKLVNDWVDDKLEVTGFGSGSTADAV